MTAVGAAAPVRIDMETALRLMATDAGAVLGSEVGVEMKRAATIRQEVEISLGSQQTVDGATQWPIAWRPCGHASLLPAFAGTLELRPDGDGTATVSIVGEYHPPLGLIGAIVDGAIGHRVAEVSVEGLVKALARRLEAKAAQRGRTTRG
jgi:hypothetical protein